MKYTDEEIRMWARMARVRGGDFVQSLAQALLYADDKNFLILRPALEQIMDKYPKYLEWARAEQARG